MDLTARHSPARRIAVFIAGLLCIAAGVALALLPGPLTLPPVILGLWLWSTEFEWAERLFRPFKKKGKEAWAHSKEHPFSSAAITVAGLAAAVAAFWAFQHFTLLDRLKELLGV